jgi:pimeloyl-[acyl-carrier protein] methyl ester esterase
MRLYFVHGWAFGPDCFDALAPLLADWPQARADLGFFGAGHIPEFEPGDVLVGHSAGFGWGMSRRADWAGAVAINGFARFVCDESGRGCVRAAELRALRKVLARDPQKCLDEFRARHGGGPCPAPDADALAAGLEFLEHWDIRHYERSEPIHDSARRRVDGFAPLAMTAGIVSPSAPTLVLAAQDDPLVPLDAARELAHSGGEFFCASGGHGLPWTAPAVCADKIRDFLRRHGW